MNPQLWATRIRNGSFPTREAFDTYYLQGEENGEELYHTGLWNMARKWTIFGIRLQKPQMVKKAIDVFNDIKTEFDDDRVTEFEQCLNDAKELVMRENKKESALVFVNERKHLASDPDDANRL